MRRWYTGGWIGHIPFSHYKKEKDTQHRSIIKHSKYVKSSICAGIDGFYLFLQQCQSKSYSWREKKKARKTSYSCTLLGQQTMKLLLRHAVQVTITSTFNVHVSRCPQTFQSLFPGTMPSVNTQGTSLLDIRDMARMPGSAFANHSHVDASDPRTSRGVTWTHWGPALCKA